MLPFSRRAPGSRGARTLIKLLLLLLLVLPAAAAAAPSNVVFIVADDLGYSDISFQGGPQIPTPHIDALFRGGAALRAYRAQPVCSPTRASIMSGRHVVHTLRTQRAATTAARSCAPWRPSWTRRSAM